MEIIDLEMIPGGPKKTCHASQFDNGRVIRFNLKENGQPFALSGSETVQAIIRKPDGSETTLDIANTSSTYVDLITEADTCDLAGVNHCEMKVTEDGEDLGSGNFDMKVEEDAYGGGDVSVGTASGPIASFETDIKDDLIECKGDISYRAKGYKQATFINSRSMPQKDTEPYLFRTSGGSLQNIGGQEHDTLVGGTVAWNQLLQNGNFATINGWSFNSGTGAVANNKLTFTITEAVASNSIYHSLETKVIQGHKYYVSAVVTPSKNAIFQSRVGNAVAPTISISANTRTNIKNIIVGDDSETTMFMIYCNRQILMAVGDTCVYENVFCIDLTQMFGSTIADYIYGLEQATAGAGVAFFKKLFPKDYYPYNAGELISVKTSAHIMRDAANNIIGNYALDSDLELRGIPKLINNKLEYDGDTYESTGAVSRKYGTVALDTLTWTYIENAKWIQSYVIPDSVNSVAAGMPNAISNINVNLADRQALGQTDLGYTIYAGRVYIRGVNLSEAELRALTVGKYLVYEKATPTAETAEPFTNPQAVSKYGTEEYIDGRTVEMPVGHSTIYGDDIQAKTATFPERIYGGSINLTTGELTSTKNADGTDKQTPDTYQLTPKNLEARSGQNNIMNDTNGNTAVKFYTRA